MWCAASIERELRTYQLCNLAITRKDDILDLVARTIPFLAGKERVMSSLLKMENTNT
jgi:hypothetical protein